MTPKPERFFTPNQVGRLLQMDASSILRWVHEGILPAYSTPGGHRRIKQVDLVAFLRAHQMYVPQELQGQRRALLVDEDPRELQALKRLLEPHAEALELHLCEHPIDALVRVGDLRPGLVVFSGAMELDPLAICKRLKRSAETSAIELFIAPAVDSPELRARAAEVGATVIAPGTSRASAIAAAVVGGPGPPLSPRASPWPRPSGASSTG